MSKRKRPHPPKRRRDPSKIALERLFPPPRDLREEREQRLVEWAAKRFLRDGGRMRPWIGIVRATGIAEFEIEKLVPLMGPEAALQAAAVLARTAELGELVFFFTRAGAVGPGLEGSGIPTGMGRGKGDVALLHARSLDGWRVGQLIHAHRVDRHTRMRSVNIGACTIDDLGDYADPSFFVDPLLDDHLARLQFPGAVAHVRRPFVSAVMAEPRPPIVGQVPARLSRLRRALEPVERVALPYPPLPWEAARKNEPELHRLGPETLCRAPYCAVPGTPPPALFDRPLAEIAGHPWSSEAQATYVASRLRGEEDILAGLELVLTSEQPERVKLFACANVVAHADERGDRAMVERAATELWDRMVAASAGDFESWLAREWPEDALDQRQLGSVSVACVTCAVGLRVDVAIGHDAPHEEVDDALAIARRVRDWLLDRCGAPPGAPAERVARLAALVLHAVPSERGESREQRWRDTMRARAGEQPTAALLRDYGAWHAAQLHSLLVVAELFVAFVRATRSGDFAGYRPEETPLAGLFGHAELVLARHLVWKAAAVGGDGSLPLLERAHAVAPRDELVLGCWNEARFRARAWSDDLLADLQRELRARPSLGVAAELLTSAEELGRGRTARQARERVLALGRGSVHAWMAEVRVTCARPARLADPAVVERLCGGSPPTEIDAADRTVHALYGPDPAGAITEARTTLAAQRDALAWEALVAEVDLETPEGPPAAERHGEPRRARPAPPTEPGEGALARAMTALRARLDRPAVARWSRKLALERHARRAAELVTGGGDSAPSAWIPSLAALVGGLDALLAAGGHEDATLLDAALDRSESALDDDLAARWQARMYQSLAALWPVVAGPAPEARQTRARAHGISEEIARADTAERRAALEHDLTTLMTAATAAPPPRSSTEPDEPSETAGPREDADDEFFPMHVAEGALEWSRRELGTPEWALREGLRQIAYFNLARGRRDLKMLRGTRGASGALWELRHRDERHPVRVLYRLTAAGPRAVAVLAKEDDAHQRRMLARIQENW